MIWLFEQQLTVAIAGILLMLAMGAAWSMTGRKELLICVGLALILTTAGLVTERLVVTDREAIQHTLLQIARDVQSNSRHAVLAHVHSSAPELKAKAEAEMPNYKFTECRVTRIHLIDVDASRQPRSALVEFNVIATGTFTKGEIQLTDTLPRWVRLQMLRENDGRWTVQNYEHAPPQQMLFNQPVE